MTTTTRELELAYTETIRTLHGDDEADNSTASYDNGWWTIQHADGATEKLRNTALQGRVDNLQQKIHAQTATTASNPNTPTPFGYLCWWTIHQHLYDVKPLQEIARRTNVPDWITEAMSGAKPESAWLRATQLGAKGTPSSTNGDANLTSRFLVRNAGDHIRLLIRETVDENELRVGVEDVGILSFSTSHGIIWEPDAHYNRDQAEVETIIQRMHNNYTNRIGKVDDGRLRNTIFRWLELRHRVCVRGTGGVYFIPNPTDATERDEIIKEATAIRNWITDATAGTFSIVATYPGGMTTIDDFRQSASDDLEDEITAVIQKLDKWDKNERMNPGSRMFSSGTQVEVLDRVSEKLAVLETSLETKLGTASAMLLIARKQALSMQHTANNTITAARTTRRIQTEQDRANRKAKRDATKDKKTGTAKDRATKKTL